MNERKKNLELDKICRVCLAQKKDMKLIFGEVMITEMLFDTTDVKIENMDGWPDKICVQCVHAVSRCHAFKTLVQKSDVELRDYIKSITVVDDTKDTEEGTILNISDSSFQDNNVLPQIVLANGQILSATQIVSHNGTQMEIMPSEIRQLLQSGSTVQMIGQNGQTQLLQLESADGDCEIMVDDSQYYQDVTVTTHDDIETTEELIHFQDEEDIIDGAVTEEEEEHIFIPEDGEAPEMLHEEDGEPTDDDMDEKTYLAEFISSQVSTPAPGRYVCNLCRKEFRQYKWMANHLKSHSNWIRANCKKQPQCDICHRSFKGPGMLKMHMKTHEVSDKIPTCTICSKQFKSKTILYRHRQIHQLRSYCCGLCIKSFSSPLTLNTHITKKHPNDEPIYKCAECSCLFTELNELKEHIQVTGHIGKSQDGQDGDKE